MPHFGILADDLTGGMMIASWLESAGAVCPLVTHVRELADIDSSAQAVVVAQQIRIADPALARAVARETAAAFAEAGIKHIYYKYSATFDSTARGNIGPIAEALMEATGVDKVVFCPAWPSYRVAVFGGRMFLGPQLLEDSFKRHDPVTPMTNSNLVEVLQAQTSVPVGLLSRAALVAGRSPALAEMDAQSAKFFLVDAVDESDITALANLTLDWRLTTGADSLAPALVRAWRGGAAPDPRSGRRLLPGVSDRMEVVLAGSCGTATLGQLEFFEASHPVLRIDVADERPVDIVVAAAVAWALNQAKQGPFAIATSASPEAVAAAQLKHGVEGAAQRSDAILAGVAAALFEAGARRFVISGGETSGAILRSLGVRRFEVSGFDELTGGYCYSKSPGPLSVIIKSGNLGGPNFFLQALDRLREAGAAHSGAITHDVD